jgi:hypothetical protein
MTNLNWLPMVTEILQPLLGSTASLITDLVGGSKSLVVAAAELRSILAVASDRMDAADRAFAKRDADEDARIASLTSKEPTKP